MIIGFIFLIRGADFVVKSSKNFARKFNLSEIFIGIVLVGIGTSLPEIIVTIKSAISGNPDIIIGNSVGSCICNILLVIGIASTINPIKVDYEILRIHLPVSAISILLFTFFCNFGKDGFVINKSEAMLLLFFAIIYIFYTTKNRSDSREYDENYENNFWKNILCFILGILGLKYGADFVVDGVVFIAEEFGISQSIISVTVVSIGTSLPEIVTSIIATMKKESNLAIGNVIGSNIFNICLLPGIGGIIEPINYDISFNKSIVFLLLITLYLLVFELFGNKRKISRNSGIIFILLFALYITCLFE